MTPEAYERRCQRITEIGCLACRRRGWYQPCDVHHLNLDEHAGQVTLGNECTIGLCPWHHRGIPFNGMTAELSRAYAGPSMKHQPVRFREEFGSDQELLQDENRLIERCEQQNVAVRVA